MTNVTNVLLQADSYREAIRAFDALMEQWRNKYEHNVLRPFKVPVPIRKIGDATQKVSIEVLRTYGLDAAEASDRRRNDLVIRNGCDWNIEAKSVSVDDAEKTGVINQLRQKQSMDGVLITYINGADVYMWIILYKDLKENYFDGNHGQHSGKNAKETAMGFIPSQDKWVDPTRPYKFFLNLDEFKKITDDLA